MHAPTQRPEDYDPHLWHNDTVYAMRLRTADPDADDWTSAFVLDIDHIVEWVDDDARMRFRVAPADLAFHDVCDLEMHVDWGASR